LPLRSLSTDQKATYDLQVEMAGPRFRSCVSYTLQEVRKFGFLSYYVALRVGFIRY